jgi:hypothetical protein
MAKDLNENYLDRLNIINEYKLEKIKVKKYTIKKVNEEIQNSKFLKFLNSYALRDKNICCCFRSKTYYKQKNKIRNITRLIFT